MANESKKKDKNPSKKLRGPIQFTTVRRFALLLVVVLSTYLPLPVSNTVKMIITIACVVVWMVLESTSMRLSMGRRDFMKGKRDKGWQTLKSVAEKPFIPLSSDEKIFLATAFIQNADDPAPGVTLLENWLKKCKNEYNRVRATNALALAYYSRLGRKEEGLSLVEGLYKSGIEDISTLINYSTFLLEEKRPDEAFDVLVKGGKNTYILDNLGVYYLVNGMHKEAIKLYREMREGINPSFVEFYVHAFQSELYFEQKQSARDLIERAYSCPRILTSPFPKEFIDRLKKDAETSSGFNHINASPYEVAFGKAYNNNNATYERASKEDIEFYKKQDESYYEDEDVKENEAEKIDAKESGANDTEVKEIDVHSDDMETSSKDGNTAQEATVSLNSEEKSEG